MILIGGGQGLYELFDRTSSRLLPAWEHLTNEERSHWEHTAILVDEYFDSDGDDDY